MGIFKTDEEEKTEEINEMTEINEITEIKEPEKPEQIYKKYERYAYSAILLDSGFNIIYKNSAAKMLNIKPRIGTNIKKYIDLLNIGKLCAAVEKGEYGIIKLDVTSPIKRCVIQPENKNITALLFYDALNFLKESDTVEFETISKIENIIGKYNERRKNLIIDHGDYFSENNRKIIRINEHFRRHMINLNSRRNDKHKIYCDIGEFLNNFSASISQYISAFGYKMNFNIFNIRDKMFFYMLSESDLLLVNFIMSAFAFKHSIFNKVDISFRDEYSVWILRYEFITENNFLQSHKNIFVKGDLFRINDIEYLDLNLAALIAKNNNLKLRVYFDEESGNKVFMDLVFSDKNYNNNNIESPRTDEHRNYISPEKIKELAEIEFAGAFGI